MNYYILTNKNKKNEKIINTKKWSFNIEFKSGKHIDASGDMTAAEPKWINSI